MISRFFTKTFTNYRQSWTTDMSGFQSSSEVFVGTFAGHLQQANPEIIENLGLNFGTTYTIWCDEDTDVKLGDRITCSGDSYDVRLIQNNGNVGTNKHLELVIEKQDEPIGS